MAKRRSNRSGSACTCSPDARKCRDGNAFAALADFICRGGDVLSQKADTLRHRVSTTKRQGGGLMDRFISRKD